MSDKSKIQWTDRTWNPVRGCSRISEGCRNCYAERQDARFSDPGQYAHGFVERKPSGPRWTGRVELIEDKLTEPLRWRKPQRVFVNSMSDLFHESLPDEAIDRVFAVMALAPHLTFQVLTKRARRMRAYFYKNASLYDRERSIERVATTFGRALPARSGWTLPLPNVWLGVSVEDQAAADERIPELLATPAAVRFLSVEPLLGGVGLKWALHPTVVDPGFLLRGRSSPGDESLRRIDWIIVGGESGPGARPCDVAWIRSVVEQCRTASVPCFVKQLGARPQAGVDELDRWPFSSRAMFEDARGDQYEALRVRDAKGGDPSEWPEDLRVREFPATAAVPA